MQNDQSTKRGARTHHPPGGREVGDVLTPAEIRGDALKRHVRAQAALRGIYDDKTLGRAVGRSRMTVGAWWKGARPEAEAIIDLAGALGLSAEELFRFVYDNGPPPSLSGPQPDVLADAEAARAEAERTDMPSPRPRPTRPASGR